MTLAWLKYILITPSIIYYRQKEIFAAQKSLRFVSDRALFRFLRDKILFRFLSDRVLFRFLSDKFLFRVLSGRIVFESLLIGSSSGSSVINSSLGSSVLFFWYATIFLSKLLLLKHVLFYILFSKRSSHLTISLTCFDEFSFNKTDSKKHVEIFAW